jgi:tetratricopeptide (TPR) repeat protein
MSRRRIFLLLIIMALAVVIWQIPSILKSIPSRYVAAYLPESMQSLAEREHVDVLPTAAVDSDSSFLLARPTVQASKVAVGGLDPIFEADAGEPIEELAPTGMEPSSTTEPSDSQAAPSSEMPSTETLMTSNTTPSPTPPPAIPSSSRLNSFDHHFQTWNNCGPATLAMGLSYFGVNQYQKQIAGSLKPNPEDRNVNPWEMEDYVNYETDKSALYRVNGDIYTLKRLIASGYPVIVELGLDPPGEYRWMGWYGHYLLLVAYDDKSEQFWAYDSWFGTSEIPVENADEDGRQVSYDDLDRYWRQFNRSYIVLFDPENKMEVEEIIGQDIDDLTMWQRARSVVQAELEADPGNAFLWFNLGTVFGALEDYEKSVVAFDQARTFGLPWRMLWYQFGPYESYYQVGRYNDVVLLADVTLLDRPYFEESYYYKGLALEALGNDREARQNLEEAIHFNPNFKAAQNHIDHLAIDS